MEYIFPIIVFSYLVRQMYVNFKNGFTQSDSSIISCEDGDQPPTYRLVVTV
jgi:hypothetical protein